MKKALALILALVMAVVLMTACNAPAPSPSAPTVAPTTDTTTPATEAPKELTGTLKVWSFTTEIKTFATAFQKANPGVKVEYTVTPMTNGEYQTKVKAAIQAGDVPDVIALEAAFVKEYVEADEILADLSDLRATAEGIGAYQFMLDVGTKDGVTKAYSYQATPGALFYRRSLAKSYFGTDDPAKMQETLADMAKFEAAAAVVKEKSAGNTYMVCSVGDFTNPIYNQRANPWVVDGKLNIDPKVNDLFAIAKRFRDNGYEAMAKQWQEGWFAGMNDSLKDAKGNAKQVFCYFLPTWGLPYVLMPHGVPTALDAKKPDAKTGKDTTGDWACIPGPLSYSWGGTWVGAMKDTKNMDLAKAFIKFMTMDEQTLKDWALGTYTNEYLKAIDPTIGDDQKQGPGDFVNSQKVVAEITPQFDSAETSKFLAGQNSYKGFADAAPKISLKLMQGTDDAIQRALNDPLDSYAAGKMTLDAAIKAFKDAVKNAEPDLIVE